MFLIQHHHLEEISQSFGVKLTSLDSLHPGRGNKLFLTDTDKYSSYEFAFPDLGPWTTPLSEGLTVFDPQIEIMWCGSGYMTMGSTGPTHYCTTQIEQ